MSAKESNRGLAGIGVIGLGVMGGSLAQNIEEHGFAVAVWNRDQTKTDRFVNARAGKQFTGASTLEAFTQSLGRPRRILVMVTAGEPVDQMIQKLFPLLEEGDILIDGGNSWFEDTRRREAELRPRGIRFFGLGVSGGETGARVGPSLMPGGDPEAYEHLRPILEAVAAKTESGPSVTHVGPDGSGHFVKMVHNGIEYGDMQVIAEAYDILRKDAGLKPEEIGGLFAEWNRGPLESFLVELTGKIFTVRDDETGRPLVDLVLDKAGQKGTGRWTVRAALDLEVPIPTIASAVDARALSGMKEQRLGASRMIGASLDRPSTVGRGELIAFVHDALHGSKICAYAQGMSLIRAASGAYGWGVNLSEIARIWKGGCIIRAKLLDAIMHAYNQRPDLANLLLDDELNSRMLAAQRGWRYAVCRAEALGIPVPAMAASLAYLDGVRAADLPQNLTQAQRDAFGSHTYERVDRPGAGFVHTDWLALASKGRAKKRARAARARRRRKSGA